MINQVFGAADAWREKFYGEGDISCYVKEIEESKEPVIAAATQVKCELYKEDSAVVTGIWCRPGIGKCRPEREQYKPKGKPGK